MLVLEDENDQTRLLNLCCSALQHTTEQRQSTWTGPFNSSCQLPSSFITLCYEALKTTSLAFFLWRLVGPTKICDVPESQSRSSWDKTLDQVSLWLQALWLFMLGGSHQRTNDTFANPVQQKPTRTQPCPFCSCKGKKGGLWSPFNVPLIFLGCCGSQKVDSK